VGRILIAGFSARGNAGDEAVLQCLYETLQPHHEVMIAVHPLHSHRDFRNWYPYDRCELVDETVVSSVLNRPLDGMVIGGGGLPPAHAAHLALTTRFLGFPTVLAGTDNSDLVRDDAAPLAFRDYMAGFHAIWLRYGSGVAATRRLGIAAEHGADWAFSLEEAPQELPVDAPACAVTVRAWDPYLHDRRFRFRLHALFHGLREQGFEPFLLPFSPDDMQLAQQIAPFLEAKIAEHWWNPRALKGLLRKCALAVSVGRLHSLILAAPTGIPICYLAPPIAERDWATPMKISELCAELAIRRYEEVDEFLGALRAGDVCPADPGLMTEVMERREHMAKAVLQALAASPRDTFPWERTSTTISGARTEMVHALPGHPAP